MPTFCMAVKTDFKEYTFLCNLQLYFPISRITFNSSKVYFQLQD